MCRIDHLAAVRKLWRALEYFEQLLLVEHRVDMREVMSSPGRWSDFGRTNTQALKITEEKVLPL